MPTLLQPEPLLAVQPYGVELVTPRAKVTWDWIQLKQVLSHIEEFAWSPIEATITVNGYAVVCESYRIWIKIGEECHDMTALVPLLNEAYAGHTTDPDEEAMLPDPLVTEDGILISEDILPKLPFKVYEKHVVEFGSMAFPLNLYGHAGYYQPFPEIGQLIREDGLV
jgi:hypothetical protein